MLGHERVLKHDGSSQADELVGKNIVRALPK